MKQCSIQLKIAYGGVFSKNISYPISVSLTGSGYPRIIPRHCRKVIYRRDGRADTMVRLFLTFFSFFTIVEKAKIIKSSLFHSIVSPVQDLDRVVSWVSKVKPLFSKLLMRYIPKIQSLPLNQGMRWIPSWKTLPTYNTLDTLYKIFPEKAKYRGTPQTMELSAFLSLIKFYKFERRTVVSGYSI